MVLENEKCFRDGERAEDAEDRSVDDFCEPRYVIGLESQVVDFRGVVEEQNSVEARLLLDLGDRLKPELRALEGPESEPGGGNLENRQFLRIG